MLLNRLKIKSKLLVMGMICVLTPIIVLVILASVLGKGTNKEAKDSLDVLVDQNLSDITTGVYNLLVTQDEALQKKLLYDLNVATDTLARKGRIALASEGKSTWEAVNQLTKQGKSVDLPQMLLGDQIVKPNKSFDAESPVVDDVQELVGDTCTIFQRMNAEGDMLRVATNVKTKEGDRAIGTYIPAVNPDGMANPVIAAVMKGETYTGRAYVVNAWYLTVYKPIKDQGGKIIGMLYVGAKQEYLDSLRKSIMGTEVGKTGYVYILGGKDDQKGHYIVSKDGARDGEDIWEAKDADGRLFIQAIVNKAVALKPGETATEKYPWKNEGENTARVKVVKIAYFEPWDWVIGAGAYEDDFNEINNRLDKGLSSMLRSFMVTGLVLAVFGIIIALVIGRAIAKPLLQTKDMLYEIAEGEGDLTSRLHVGTQDEIGELANNFNKFVEKLQGSMKTVTDNTVVLNKTVDNLTSISHDLAGGVQQMSNQSTTVASAAEEVSANVSNVTGTAETMSKQSNNIASAAEEMSSNVKNVATAIEEMTSSLQEVSKSCVRASSIANDATKNVESTNQVMSHLNTSSQEIGKVVDVINDIADQTNLLALNATIEAARAGEAGKGFAVVANEVKELAKQTAEATTEITQQIGDMQAKTTEAVKAIETISEIIKEINNITNNIATAVEEQTATTNEISRSVTFASQGTDEVTKNVLDLNISIDQEVVRGIKEAAKGAGEISMNIQGVGAAANQMAGLASSTKDVSDDIAKLVQQLQQVVNQFRV